MLRELGVILEFDTANLILDEHLLKTLMGPVLKNNIQQFALYTNSIKIPAESLWR